MKDCKLRHRAEMFWDSASLASWKRLWRIGLIFWAVGEGESCWAWGLLEVYIEKVGWMDGWMGGWRVCCKARPFSVSDMF